jgi:K+-transporting ATPase A subunit
MVRHGALCLVIIALRRWGGKGRGRFTMMIYKILLLEETFGDVIGRRPSALVLRNL